MNDTMFQLINPFLPSGDQPKAISQLVTGLNQGLKDQILLGVTGSGKTFTIANVIAQTNRPTMVISHNKTLAAQLYNEFKTLFPHNAVCYFVSTMITISQRHTCLQAIPTLKRIQLLMMN